MTRHPLVVWGNLSNLQSCQDAARRPSPLPMLPLPPTSHPPHSPTFILYHPTPPFPLPHPPECMREQEEWLGNRDVDSMIISIGCHEPPGDGGRALGEDWRGGGWISWVEGKGVFTSYSSSTLDPLFFSQ